jgi:N-acetylmuramoyl-L-alanine amidase
VTPLQTPDTMRRSFVNLRVLRGCQGFGRPSALTLGASLLLLLISVIPAHAHKSEAWARSQFSTAERMREALNGRPAKERSRRQYQQVITAYRRVYYGAPASTKADPSVVAVAELMVEMGRRFDDDKILRSAVGQYAFLRREYPGSKYRFDALFTIGEIYKDDLNDPAKARATFQEFLHRYPRNHLADEARSALAEEPKPGSASVTPATTKDADAKDADQDDSSAKSASTKDSDDAPARISTPARVTGIRHWSTPDYTRVAIDLEQDVKFESQRIDHPDRIFFDLLGTKLASTLVGKTFDVDDGFLKKIRVAQFQPGKSRVVLEVDDLSDYNAFLLPNPTRLIIDIHGKGSHARMGPDRVDAGTSPAPPIEAKATKPDAADKDKEEDDDIAADTTTGAPPLSRSMRQGGDVPTTKPAVSSTKSAPKKVVVEADDNNTVAVLDPPEIKPVAKAAPSPVTSDAPKSRTTKSKRKPAPELDIREAQPTSTGDRSLIRALGLKIGKIVIDPGHGGHDTGTIGPNGLLEKDLVLDVGRRLGKLLEARLGAPVVFTRDDDTFIPLETRTAIANQEQADLFVSIHANSSSDPDARGVETYYLNFTSSPEALEVAARENAVSDKSIHELQDLVKKIALKEKIDESKEFAGDVQHALHSGLAAKSPGIRDRGVKKAPFIVLIGANMPSILAEISFVSNPGDERRLETPEYRQKIAESLFRGIAKYVNGLSGVKVAKIE